MCFYGKLKFSFIIYIFSMWENLCIKNILHHLCERIYKRMKGWINCKRVFFYTLSFLYNKRVGLFFMDIIHVNLIDINFLICTLLLIIWIILFGITSSQSLFGHYGDEESLTLLWSLWTFRCDFLSASCSSSQPQPSTQPFWFLLFPLLPILLPSSLM